MPFGSLQAAYGWQKEYGRLAAYSWHAALHCMTKQHTSGLLLLPTITEPIPKVQHDVTVTSFCSKEFPGTAGVVTSSTSGSSGS